jgi:hypothetical protein
MSFWREHMATSKRAQYQFKVKEGGDVEDIKRDVKHDTSRLRNTEETWRTVLEEIKASLRADDVTGALEHLKALEYQVNHLLHDWKRALQQYQWFV